MGNTLPAEGTEPTTETLCRHVGRQAIVKSTLPNTTDYIPRDGLVSITIYKDTGMKEPICTIESKTGLHSTDFSGKGTIQSISVEWTDYATPGLFWGAWNNRDHVFKIKFFGKCEKIIASKSGFRIYPGHRDC